MPQFHLIPFANKPPDSTYLPSFDLTINGQIKRSKYTIDIFYVVRGDVSQIIWPEISAKTQRMDELWKHTCFELFVQPVDGIKYYEYNLSPSGNWNAYGFNDYRQGQQNLSINTIDINMDTNNKGEIILCGSIPLTQTVQARTARIGISAVVEDIRHQRYYYALSHQGETPDFHLRESFSIEIDSESV